MAHYRTLDEFRQANERAGYHFFSPDTMRFFSSRVGNTVYHVADGTEIRTLFITSEQFVDSQGNANPRRYTIREALADGSTRDIGGFQTYATRNAAIAGIREFGRELTRQGLER